MLTFSTYNPGDHFQISVYPDPSDFSYDFLHENGFILTFY